MKYLKLLLLIFPCFMIANPIISTKTSTAVLSKISGTVKNGAIPINGAKVAMVLNYQDATHQYKQLSATSDAQGNYAFNDADIAGYLVIESIVMNAWENAGVTYSPASYTKITVASALPSYNFNSQSTQPIVAITNPTTATITSGVGTPIIFKANASLTANDGSTTIASVIFNINGVNITGIKTTGDEYTANWTPAIIDFNKNYTLNVKATTSTSISIEANANFALKCSGANCPNQSPLVTWVTPSQDGINQASGFQAIPVNITITDPDGTITSATISIDGIVNDLVAGANNSYTYTFTPNQYKDYAVIVKAIDNSTNQTSINKTLKITKSTFNPLPAKVVMGYAHGFSNGAPNLKFSDIAKTNYNVIQYAFIETANRDGFTPILTANETLYLTNGTYNPQLLKDDIKAFRAKGIPVIASIGGQNGHVVLETIAQKNTFVTGIKTIVDQYGFDGIDLDFEGSSMNFGAGALKDISYAGISAYPKLKNVVDACKELKAHYGSGFLLTAAPETQYVQGGYSTYSDTYGSFLPVIQNLRNELDLLAVQLYNTGGENGLDGKYYSSGTGADMLDALTDMLIKGYNIGTTGMRFDGLPASKILIGLPCNAAAAGSGYKTPAVVIQALDYLRFGTTFSGRTYTLQPGGPHPTLRGVMTWSINWDASTGNEFVNAYSTYFGTTLSNPESMFTNNDLIVYFKDNSLLLSNEKDIISKVEIYNSLGQNIVNVKNSLNDKNIKIQNNSLATKQLYIVVVTDIKGTKKSTKVFNF